MVSTRLHLMSSNPRRLPPKSDARNGWLDMGSGKRRRLGTQSRSPPQDVFGQNFTRPTSCDPTSSSRSALRYRSNQSAQVPPETDYFSSSIIESDHSGYFRKEIMIELFGIENKLDEIEGLCTLTNAEVETRCTLEIFATRDEEMHYDKKCGELLWLDQQMGTIQSKCDDFGHSTSRVILPGPFLILAEDLFVKRPSNAMINTPGQIYSKELAEQYVVKIWFEAPSPESRWPPMELESALVPEGRMTKWLSEGAYSNTDIRLGCKGVLFPQGGSLNNFHMVLKMGGVQQQSNYRLRLDIQYLLPTSSLDLALRPYCSQISEVKNPSKEDDVRAESSCQKSPKSPPLIIPITDGRLCHTVTKHILQSGEQLYATDSDLETRWRTAKHLDTIRDHPGITSDAEDYILKWDLFTTPLRLSSNYYVPQVLLGFVEENGVWLTERPSRIREFSLHATSLRLRGSIGTECFAKCIALIHDCKRLNAELEEASQNIVVQDADTDEDSADEKVVERVAVIEEDGIEEDGVEEDGYQGAPDQNKVFEEIMNDNAARNIHILTSQRDLSRDSAEEEAIYEDASENPQKLAIDDYFDAEDGEDSLQEHSHLHTCWHGITERWPQLKLHGTYSFGVATVLAAIAIFQGFPDDNIDRLIALYIHYCPSENIQDLTNMYKTAFHLVPEVEGICITELKLHKIMWEASRETCEVWLADVYRLEDGSRRTVHDAIETSMNADAWDELWESIARVCSE